MASSVNLGDRLESFVDELVKNGRYNSRSEVLREGVRIIQEREARLAALDALVAEAEADVAAGRVHDLDEVFDELEARYSGPAEARARA